MRRHVQFSSFARFVRPLRGIGSILTFPLVNAIFDNRESTNDDVKGSVAASAFFDEESVASDAGKGSFCSSICMSELELSLKRYCRCCARLVP
jgi:hypothetical protein